MGQAGGDGSGIIASAAGKPLHQRFFTGGQNQDAYRPGKHHFNLRTALNLLLQMRQREGQALWADLQVHLNRIETALESVRTQAPLVARQYHEKLRARVMQMVAEAKLSLQDNDLLREVVLFTDRCDISEELTRMAGHLHQFSDTCRNESQAGRKLDFIAQEMLREANTIGSKAGDGAIVRSIVDIKGAIDRIKEQVQNVE